MAEKRGKMITGWELWPQLAKCPLGAPLLAAYTLAQKDSELSRGLGKDKGAMLEIMLSITCQEFLSTAD